MATLEQAALYASIEASLGFKPKTVRDFIAKNSDLHSAFQALAHEPGFNKGIQQAFLDKAQSILQTWTDVKFLRRGEPDYPVRLASTLNAPEFLYVRGDVKLLSKEGVSVVGSRAASEDGKVRAFRIAKMLSANSYVVFSGLAKGIDTAAHLGALKVHGTTVAVIGTPIDRSYPAENSELQKLIAEKGAVVSQFSPLQTTQRLNFPMRNETMSGMSLATVIVEASETSGALIQAKHTLKQKRLLFIMKNQIERKDLAWPSEFLNKGARSMSEFEDLLQALKNSPPTSNNGGDGQLRML